jgi:hypothetical protein
MKGADEQCLQAGMYENLPKHIDREALQACLRRFLSEEPQVPAEPTSL